MTVKEAKNSIPSVNVGTTQDTTEAMRFFDALKQNIDVITGRAKGLTELGTLDPKHSSLETVINTVNAIIERLNASGS
jgi:hypothetical protein